MSTWTLKNEEKKRSFYLTNHERTKSSRKIKQVTGGIH